MKLFCFITIAIYFISHLQTPQGYYKHSLSRRLVQLPNLSDADLETRVLELRKQQLEVEKQIREILSGPRTSKQWHASRKRKREPRGFSMDDTSSSRTSNSSTFSEGQQSHTSLDSGFWEPPPTPRLINSRMIETQEKTDENPEPSHDPGFWEAPQTPRVMVKVQEKTDDNPGEERFLERVFEESGTFISCSPTDSTQSHGCSSSSQSGTTPPTSFLSTPENSQGTEQSRKRKREGDEDENEDEERGQRKRSNKQRRPDAGDPSGQRGQQRRRLACHFHIFDKRRYSKNNETGKKYETCSGPGWPTMHHLKQHLGHSASSVHKKTRCPHCLKSFKTAGAVLKHQKAHPRQCWEQASNTEDDIDESTWERIDNEITRQGFSTLPKSVQEEINLWVLDNLDTQAQGPTVEELKWELRKWNMAWRILFPSYGIPSRPFYEEDVFTPITNTALLVKSFKETVESRIEVGDIGGVDDETLDKLLDSLQVAISIASNTANSERRDPPPHRPLRSTAEGTLAELPEGSDEGIIRGNESQESPNMHEASGSDALKLTTLPPNTAPITALTPPLAAPQQTNLPEPIGATLAMDIQPSAPGYLLQPIPGIVLGDWPSSAWPGSSNPALDQVLEWNPEWDQIYQNHPYPLLNSSSSELEHQDPAGKSKTDLDFGFDFGQGMY